MDTKPHGSLTPWRPGTLAPRLTLHDHPWQQALSPGTVRATGAGKGQFATGPEFRPVATAPKQKGAAKGMTAPERV